MTARGRFPNRIISRLRESRMIGIRAGVEPHRFTPVWFVVVDRRVFVRPWNDKATGWHRAFQRDPVGAIEIAGREVPVRARTAFGERLFDSIDAGYAEKYPTKASRKWVRGFRLPRRRRTTTELRPA
jgi:hypothetical protein